METIGKYQIQRVLGRGGMGTVYEALDPVIQRTVAVKTMAPGLADTPDLRTRFLREAQAAGGLKHRNIVTVYDLGEDKGRPFIAMEFIEGTDLEKIIQNRKPYSLEWKLSVLAQICDGLAYAHRNGIVHRDVKPANIRVTGDGEVKIMDFGIAHLQSSTMTRSGLVLGTVHYMAPEQVEGHKVDHRADIFSVGAIAYELVAYRKPFDGDSLTGVMYKIIHEPPDPRGLPENEYPPTLRRIVLKALEKRPEERYQTLDEMHAAIQTLLRPGGVPAAAPPPGQGIDSESATVSFSVKQEGQGMEAGNWVLKGVTALKGGDVDEALRCARKALAAQPDSEPARALLRDAEAEALHRRVEREVGEIRAEAERARVDGQLQKALGLWRKILDLNPEDVEANRAASEIQKSIQERELEQLSSMALSYAADGDMELALKIAAKIERLAPGSPKAAELKAYLEEESARRQADALTATAQEHLAMGNLEEARAAAAEALVLRPGHSIAREIHERASGVLAARTVRIRAPDVFTAEVEEPPPAPKQAPPAAVTPRPAPAVAPRVPPPPPKSTPPSQPPQPPNVQAAAQAPAKTNPPRPAPQPAPVAAAPAPVGKTGVPPTQRPAPPPRPPASTPMPAAAKAATAPPTPGPKGPAPAAPQPAPRPAATSAAAAAAPTAGGPREPAPTPPPAREPTPPPPPAVSVAKEVRPAPRPAPQASPDPVQLTPLPEGPPSNPKAVELLDQARRLLRERAALKALPLLEEAASLEPTHKGIERILSLTRIEAKKVEVEALTTAALNHFLQNEYGKARKAVDKALALEPENKKAKELMKILGSLG